MIATKSKKKAGATMTYNKEQKIEQLLFKQVEKPKKMFSLKVINVYNDRYRINVWAKVEEDGIEKNKIASSYFVSFKNDELKIIS